MAGRGAGHPSRFFPARLDDGRARQRTTSGGSLHPRELFLHAQALRAGGCSAGGAGGDYPKPAEAFLEQAISRR